MNSKLPSKKFTEINRRLSSLNATIDSIKKELADRGDSVRHMLHRRGYAILRENSKENLILPMASIINGEEVFYEMLLKYSFRIFLRDVIRLKAFTLKEVSRFSSEDTVKGYLDFLKEMRLIKVAGLRPVKYNFIPNTVYNFGDTLEWLVAQVYRREFSSDSSWGVTIKNTKAGGDYDVISSVEGRVVYTEVKSSPPKHIEIKEIEAFLSRVDEIKPDLSIFLEDTELRMKDKIVFMFEEGLKNRFGKESKKIFPVKRVLNEIFSINERVFIINSKPDLIFNIGICIKSFLKGKYLYPHHKFTRRQ
jgi:hypothetical protein